jgi:hypothetical protein
VTCIIFKFRPDVPAPAQDRLLESIATWDSQSRAGRLYLGTQSADKKSLCYVYVADETAARSILQRLQETNEVEYAHVPQTRQVAQVSQ